MAPAEQQDVIRELEDHARRRFVRWDAALWRELCAGPAADLAAGLAAAGAPATQADPLLAGYLRLGCEAIGLGYLFPSSAGAESFFTLAWTRLIPTLLAGVPADRRATALAACWNLGENLERAPTWLRKIFVRLTHGLGRLDDLGALVADVERQALSPPSRPLGAGGAPTWIHLGAEDTRFLPGTMHFVAPTVVCVHDRHRVAGGGRDAATIGVWLADPPLVLGTMACAEAPPRDVSWSAPGDEEPFASARNEWRAVVSLVTSQFVVAQGPAP
jgi:hypothetical protein